MSQHEQTDPAREQAQSAPSRAMPAAGIAPHHIVGIGASAGGLEAIEAFVTNLPPDTGMAFVVIQHLSPDYKSMMVELLSKRTELPVLSADDRTPVAPDTIYVIQPRQNITITGGELRLTQQEPGHGINLPIDIFFRSLAEDQGERAVGVVLSGTGSDGMRGVRSIKAAGGLVMVQDIRSAKFDGMPASAISTGVADFVLEPSEMPERLVSWIRHPYVMNDGDGSALQSNEDLLMRIFELLQDRHGINFAYYKMTTVMRRLERRLTICRLESIAEYIDLLEQDTREVTALYRELLIGVTSFFRDREAFDALRSAGLRELVASKAGGTLRAWVSGCSTGEEAYTLAIMIDQICRERDVAVEVKVFATDIDQDSLAFAAAGRYPASIAADLPAEVLHRYFVRHDDAFQVTRSIRETVVFAPHNLVGDPPFTHIDLVSCRNLLIYLQPVLQRKALEIFNFALEPGGLLFLGKSETIGAMRDHFEPLHQKWRLYRSRGKRTPGMSLETTQAPEWRRAARSDERNRVLSTAERRKEESTLARFLELVAPEYFPPAVVVSERNEIRHVIGDVSPFLRLPDGRMLNDITKMARDEISVPIATGVQKAFRTREPVAYAGVVTRGLQGGPTALRLRFVPLPDRPHAEPLVAIVFEPEGGERGGPGGDERALDAETATHDRIHDLEQELQFTRESLQATIEELETSNEELQATNEELLASNEELQSTNEELQAANEEIHTVNAENQSRISDLTKLSADLENLLTSSDVGTIVIDESMTIRIVSSIIPSLTNVRLSDVGRSIGDLRVEIGGVDMAATAARVMETRREWEERLTSLSGKRLLVRVRPYRAGPDEYSGVLITLIDISELDRALAELALTKERLELAFEGTEIAWWDWDRDTGDVTASSRKFTMLGYEPGEAGSTIEEWIARIHPEDKPESMEAMRRLLDGRASDYRTRYRLRHKNGGWVELVDQGWVAERDEEGAPVRIIGTVRAAREG